MILTNVNKFPIVVIGPPRGGTSVICRQIGIELGIRHFNDITYAPDKTEIDTFIEYITTTDKYVVKFHPFDMQDYPSWLIEKVYSNLTYNVKIIRTDVSKQITSAYIAQMRNLYTYDSINTEQYTEDLEVNLNKLKHCIQRIQKNNMELDNLSVKFDSIIDYEKLDYNTFVSTKTPQPSNYEVILKLVRSLI